MVGSIAPACVARTATSVPAAAPDPATVRTVLRAAARPLSGVDRDFDPLLTLIGDARFVLIGEATHGTHEFYRDRAKITQRLIAEKGFTAVAIEGDWPDAERVNRYVRGVEGADAGPEQALSDFTRRFPRWMWANTDVRDFVRRLREHNQALPAAAPRAGFYGLDVYSLGPSANAVVRTLETVDGEAARRARRRYAVFAPFHSEPERYGLAVLTGRASGAERDAREQFEEAERLYRQAMGTGPGANPARNADALFSVLQNARVVRNAEEYYRTMYRGGVSGWNLRDKHMADSMDALAEHLTRRNGRPAKIVVWAHNSHVGDARWTQTGDPDEWNIGQLTRERHPKETVLVGFTTYSGTVFAAREWGETGQERRVLPALPGSFAAVFHEAGISGGDFLLLLRGNRALAGALPEPRLERAIGVVYLPETERQSHYFLAHLTRQFDAVIHRDVTRAITPLKR
jgi:erythromycin esterase-like protein